MSRVSCGEQADVNTCPSIIAETHANALHKTTVDKNDDVIDSGYEIDSWPLNIVDMDVFSN